MYDYKWGLLRLSPHFLISLSAPLLYRAQLVQKKPDSLLALVKEYVSPFKRCVTPYYLLNAYFWNAGHIAIMVTLFSYISEKSQTSVAILSFSLIGAGNLIGTFLCMVYLSKFTLNHFMLQLAAHIILGSCSMIYAFVDNHIAYYITSTVVGMAHGTTVANMASLSSHLYPAKNVEGAFAFQEAVGGIAGFIGPVTTGIIQSRYSGRAGLCYISANGLMAAVILVVAALYQPTLWKPFVNVPQLSDMEKRESSHKIHENESSFQNEGFNENPE